MAYEFHVPAQHSPKLAEIARAARVSTETYVNQTLKLGICLAYIVFDAGPDMVPQVLLQLPATQRRRLPLTFSRPSRVWTTDNLKTIQSLPEALAPTQPILLDEMLGQEADALSRELALPDASALINGGLSYRNLFDRVLQAGGEVLIDAGLDGNRVYQLDVPAMLDLQK